MNARALVIGLAFFLLPATGTAQAAPPDALPPELVAASATSYAEGSSPIVCLLDPECSGYWSPQTRDGGENEGIYLRFRNPVPLTFIKILVEGDDPNLAPIFTVYLDAKTSDGQTAGKNTRETESGPAMYLASRHFAEDGRTGQVTFIRLGSSQGGAYAARSVFIKIEETRPDAPPLRVRAIRLFDTPFDMNDEDFVGTGSTPVALRLPVAVKAAAAASSILEPTFAYDASHLFDSQLDMAWSTNGKTTSGIGESVTLAFDAPQTVGSLMLWNGYQRSDTHYKANGRVKRLRVNDMEVAVKDVQSAQEIKLPKPLTAQTLKLTITGIYPGGSYKDVLISELRLLTPDGRIILPQVAPPAIAIPAGLDFLQDTTFARLGLDVVGHPADSTPDEFGFCPEFSMRLRSNGTFVIYQDDEKEDDGPSFVAVREGNWEVTGPKAVRLFGKKYQVNTYFSEAGYLPDPSQKPNPALQPRIFQSVMSIRRYAELPKQERQNLLHLVAGRTPIYQLDERNKAPRKTTVALGLIEGNSEQEMFTGDSLQEALDKLDIRLLEVNPVCAVSDVYSDILLPASQVRTCDSGP